LKSAARSDVKIEAENEPQTQRRFFFELRSQEYSILPSLPMRKSKGFE